MIFAKLDVDFYDHPRFLLSNFAAIGLWACALAYCRKHAYDAQRPGRFPKAADFLRRPGATPAAKKLVEVGLWLEQADTYEIHNYEAKNETKEDIDIRRELDRDRQKRYREERKRSRDASRDGHVTSQSDGDACVTGSGSEVVVSDSEASVPTADERPSEVRQVAARPSTASAHFNAEGEWWREGIASLPQC